MACNSLSLKCVGNLPVDNAEGGQEKKGCNST